MFIHPYRPPGGQRKNAPYVVLDHRPVRDSRLSWGARGLLVFCLSLPQEWRITIEWLSRQGLNGRDACARFLRELETYGYLERHKGKDANGRWNSRNDIYELSTQPYPKELKDPVTGKPLARKPDEGVLDWEFPKSVSREGNRSNDKKEQEEVKAKEVKAKEVGFMFAAAPRDTAHNLSPGSGKGFPLDSRYQAFKEWFAQKDSNPIEDSEIKLLVPLFRNSKQVTAFLNSYEYEGFLKNPREFVESFTLDGLFDYRKEMEDSEEAKDRRSISFLEEKAERARQ